MRLYEKGEIVTGEDLWALAAMSGIDVDKQVSANMLQRAGLNAALIQLKNATGSYESALRAAGFKTRASEHATKVNEADLRAYLLAYNGGSKRTPVRVRDMMDDHSPAKPGTIQGNQLAARLRMFAEENKIVTRADGTKEYGTSQADTIKYFGFKTAGYRRKKGEIIDDLRAIWPKALVEQAYAGQTTLPQICDLKKSKTLRPLFQSITSKGTAGIVNRLYPEFPDLHNYVTACSTPANPEVLRRQLRDAFYSGENVSTNLMYSKNPHERKLYWRVMSLKKEPAFGARLGSTTLFGKKREAQEATFNQILSYLLPEFSGRELDIEPGATKRQGTIGELFTEWLLRWSTALNPNGFGDVRFRKLFGLPVNAIYAGKHAHSENVLLPDLVTRGQQTTFVEVRTGERVATATRLANKYEGRTEFVIEGLPVIRNPDLVAVLHMPKKATKLAAPILLDAGYEVVHAEQFLGWLEQLAKKVPEETFAKATPRVSIDSLIDAYKRLVHSPISFIRPGADYEMRFLKSTLETLVRHELEDVAS